MLARGNWMPQPEGSVPDQRRSKTILAMVEIEKAKFPAWETQGISRRIRGNIRVAHNETPRNYNRQTIRTSALPWGGVPSLAITHEKTPLRLRGNVAFSSTFLRKVDVTSLLHLAQSVWVRDQEINRVGGCAVATRHQ